MTDPRGKTSVDQSDEHLLDWLQLIRTDTIGPITFQQLIGRFGTARTALDALPDLARKSGRKRPLRPPPRESVEAELERARKIGADLIISQSERYPTALKAIPDAPPVLFMRGHDTLLQRDGVAIVGARNASTAGRKITRDLAEGLGESGVVVVSGLARGIDGAAHAAALSTGTIAVVAGGVDIVYPPEHRELTERIAHEGVILSERPPGKEPTARDFPRRNRLISGLSFGVIVVEAAAKSGTLITARFALEQGREVFAVPGSPLDPRCHGANRLIRDGATLIETADDVLEVFKAQKRGVRDKGRDLFEWAQNESDASTNTDLSKSIEATLRDMLSFTPIHRDDFLRDVDAPANMILAALMTLVLSGFAEEHSGGRFSLAVKSED